MPKSDNYLEKTQQWQPLLDVLIKNKDLQWKTTSDIKQLVKYIDSEYEAFCHEAEDLKEALVICLFPTDGYINRDFQNENVWRFLASLYVQKIITDLHLPIYIKRKNQQMVEVQGLPVYFDPNSALKEAITNPEKFKRSFVRFKIPDWNKFEKIRDKVYADKQTLVLENKTGEPVVIQPTDLDLALAYLKPSVLKSRHSGEWVFGDIELGAVSDGLEGEETKKMLCVADFLKSERVIDSYQVIEREDTIIYKNKNKDTSEPIPFVGYVARCKFKPSEALEFMKQHWHPTHLKIKQIADLYLKLIKVVEAYFKQPEPDVQLNAYYVQIDTQIKDLLTGDLPPRLRLDYDKPFADLLSAHKQIEQTKTTLQSHLNSVYAFYGVLQDFLNFYNLNPELAKVEGLEDYLSDLNAKQEEPKFLPSPQETQPRTESPKKAVFISTDYGIYLNKATIKPNYAIKGKRAKLLWLLKDGRKLTGKFMAETLGQTLPLVSKELEAVNTNFKEILKLQDDLVIRVDTGGHRLNKELFEVKFLE